MDVFVTKFRGRRKAVLVADMDSTIVTTETLDEIAAYAGLKDKIAAITQRSMNGEIDFADRTARARGDAEGAGPLGAGDAPGSATEFCPGARTLVATMRAFRRHHGAGLRRLHLLHRPRRRGSSASTCTAPTRCWITARALTGEVGEPILDRDAKLAALNELAAKRGVKLSATLAVGDGANDLAMLQRGRARRCLLRQAGRRRAGAEPHRAYGLDLAAFRTRLSGKRIQRGTRGMKTRAAVARAPGKVALPGDGRYRRPEGRRGAGGGQGHRHLPYRRIHALRRRPGRHVPGHSRP